MSEAEKTMIPADDLARSLVVKDVETAMHLGLVGDTYTVLLRGEDTAGRHCLIDMYVPPGGGPPPHRHDFEESFTLLEGELEFTFRGEKQRARAGVTVHVPANAPHMFRNVGDGPARMLCICSPAGQEGLFEAVGVKVGGRTEAPPKLSEAEMKAVGEKAVALAAEYKTEML
ncbi:MAG: cupin domain-containing protein [Edaphobacter sp.]|uniref:cupin domain-containing protein n=1 Tax=Edaphobacter sp. TaxID=1934404 RepID=UPI00239DDB98|nr:cupin domain-containing protein [Edaphobacter sp.]MDE1177394.1 cupin domain-containing protein [Edaphobacter sp.]